MFYLVFTVDGDWKEYFNINLPEEERLPEKEFMQKLIEQEIEVADRLLDGKLLHFIHASPRVRDFFLKEPFLGLWKRIVEGRGDIGVHCHEDDPYKEYYFRDTERMKEVISQQVKVLNQNGLNPRSYRGGWLIFSNELTPVLEENGLEFDFSCEPDRYLVQEDKVLSDWRGAPKSLYRLSYEDYKKPGGSRVFEVPVGVAKGKYLYFEKSGVKELEEIALVLKEESEKESKDVIVSVLTHSYEYKTTGEIENISDKISVLKEFGRFINIKELSEIINKQ
ncbi:MAG: hypothetical protein JSW17_04490 [Candidatus Omnitrophota bacterium]|nr:MAG: hypothetical protein JSW17_04490 [Candidatus Omnitrophota bacterium]